MRLTEDLSSAKVQLTKQTEETEVEKQIRKKAEAALVQAHKRDMVRAAKTRLVLGLLGWTVAGVILASIFVYIVKWAYPRSNLAQIIFDVVSIGAPAAAAFWQIFSKVIPKYRHERTSAAKRAEELVREELG
jgi:cell division protein FtsX